MSETTIGENFTANNEVSTSAVEPYTKGKDHRFQCTICEIKVSGKKNYEAHLHGAKHSKKLKEHSDEINSQKNWNNGMNTKMMNKKSISPNMKKCGKEANSTKSHNLKRNLKTSFVRQDYSLNNNNYDYSSQNNFQHRFQSNRRARGNWNNYKYNAWYDRSYSDNCNSQYNNRSYRYYRRINNRNYYQNQQEEFESMENFGGQERHEAESVRLYPEDNNTEWGQENSKMPQNHIIYDDEHSLNLDSPKENLDKINCNKNDSFDSAKESSVLPLKLSQTEKCVNIISDNASYFSESTSKTNSTSTNSEKTKYTQEKKKSDDMGSTQHSSETNCGNVAILPSAKNSFECDKQSDKKAPSENMTDRISHWINPSSLKDKAEVDKLMTEYSKSKKKENLLRLKLHGEKSISSDKCDNSIETRFQAWEHLQSPLNSINLDHEKNETLKIVEETNVTTKKVSDSNLSDIQRVTKSPKAKRRKKSSLSESGLCSNDTILSDLKSPVSRSSSLNRNRLDICTKKQSRASIDSSFHDGEVIDLDMSVDSDYIILGKRRNSLQQITKSKKHKCSALECLEKCIHEEREKLQDGQVSNAVTENSQVYNEIYINNEELNLKKETLENLNQDLVIGEGTSKQESSHININNSQILDVEDLMKMFAAQNVKIKKEFDDPLIDAIQSMDVNLLLNVCDQQSKENTSLLNSVSQVQSSRCKEKTGPLSSSVPQAQSSPCVSEGPSTQLFSNSCNQGNKKSSDSNLFSSSDNPIEKPLFQPCDNDKLTDSRVLPISNNSIPGSSIEGCDLVKCISNDADGLLPKGKINSIQNSDFFENIFPGLSPINLYVNISNELKKLQKEEEEKRANLKNIEKLIEKHQIILNNLNASKIKLQTEEDNLISRRNSLTCALSHCISRDSFNTSADSDTSSMSFNNVKSTESLPPKTKIVLNETNQTSIVTVTENSFVQINSQIDAPNPTYQIDVPNPANQIDVPNPTNQIDAISVAKYSDKQILSRKDVTVEDNEDVMIIAQQGPASEIPVIDLVDLESPEKQKETLNKENGIIFSKKHIYEIKDFAAHKTVVNYLKVLNQYLYSCANDYTAKRFNLENLDEIVTYTHKKRNVLHLCVETYKDTTIVFTLCSLDKFISLFKADDGLPLKKYSFEFVATSITNGWGKVFSGLNNGQVVVCNSKETKDLVRNLEPVKSMACTYQGGLHILVILSINGQVAVRDVDRNGLLIRYVKAHNDTPLFMNVYNDYVYLSSSIVLTATDLTSGNLKHKIKLTSPITGLAAYEHDIFTTSFSGLIRCYPNGQAENMKMAYGVGNSVTSICVNKGWVFTANRNGEIGAFKFDPLPEFHCQFGNCQYVFTRKDDLKRHVLNGIDHQPFNKFSKKCPWKKCGQQFSKDWKSKDKKYHLEYHVNDYQYGLISADRT